MTAPDDRIRREVPLILTAFLLIFLTALLLLIKLRGPVMIEPEPVAVDYRISYVISDTEKMLSAADQKKLHQAMDLFREKTGGMPAVQIIPYSQWSQYASLQGYTDTSYHGMFQDEKHVLIVCAEPKAWESLADWHVDVMAGKDLQKLLTPERADDMREEIRTALKEKSSGIGAAVADSLEAKATQLMERRPDTAALSDILLEIMFFGTAITVTGTALNDTIHAVRLQKNWQKEKAREENALQ